MNYPLFSFAAIAILQVTVPGQCGSNRKHVSIDTTQNGSYENHVSMDTGPDTSLVPSIVVQPKLYPVVIAGDFYPDISDGWHDNEFEPSEWQIRNCNECSAKKGDYEWEKLKYFKELVYDPAMANPHLPSENKRFLKALYAFMIRDTLPLNDFNEPTELIRPVYKFNDRHVRICSDFDKFDDYGQPVIRLSYRDTATQYYLFRSNSSRIRPCMIRGLNLYRTECSWFRSYELYVAPLDDTLQPAFCSPYRIVLDYRGDTTMNRMLKEKNRCESNCRWFSGACNLQSTFAQLKEVPNLWFTTDADGWQEAGFQTRALYLNIDGKYLLELWRYELDMTSLGCI